MNDRSEVKKYVDCFSSWISGKTDIEKIDTWNDLRYEVLEKASNDYLFFPFFVGCVERYIWGNYTPEELMEICLGLVKDLFLSDLIKIYYINSSKMEEVNCQNKKEEKDRVIEKIKRDWIATGKEIPEVNQVAWFVTTEKGEEYLKFK